jgi:hypothetical protein
MVYSCNQFLSSPLVVDATFGFEGGENVHCGQVDWVACFVCNPCELQIKSIHGQMEFWRCDLGIGIVCQEFI